MKSPLGRVVVPVDTEEKWKQLTAACEKHEYGFRWICGGEKPTEFINWKCRKDNSAIFFNGIKLSTTTIAIERKFLSFETAMKKLGCPVKKKVITADEKKAVLAKLKAELRAIKLKIFLRGVARFVLGFLRYSLFALIFGYVFWALSLSVAAGDTFWVGTHLFGLIAIVTLFFKLAR